MNKAQANYAQSQSLCQKKIKMSNQFLIVKTFYKACISKSTNGIAIASYSTLPMLCTKYMQIQMHVR